MYELTVFISSIVVIILVVVANIFACVTIRDVIKFRIFILAYNTISWVVAFLNIEILKSHRGTLIAFFTIFTIAAIFLCISIAKEEKRGNGKIEKDDE